MKSPSLVVATSEVLAPRTDAKTSRSMVVVHHHHFRSLAQASSVSWPRWSHNIRRLSAVMRWAPPTARHAGRPPSALPLGSARPLKLWQFALVGISAYSIAKISLHPRLKLLRDSTGWTLRYDYAKAFDPGPAEKGLEIPPARGAGYITEPKQAAASQAAENTSWILDTGANGHMCTNREMMHNYTELTWGQSHSGFRSASGGKSDYQGIGDCTLQLNVPGPAGKRDSPPGSTKTSAVTLQRVHFYPTTGLNLISWSEMKRGASRGGQMLKLVENNDWSLGVNVKERNGTERQIMRFKPVNGLYVLDQPAKPPKPKEGDNKP